MTPALDVVLRSGCLKFRDQWRCWSQVATRDKRRPAALLARLLNLNRYRRAGIRSLLSLRLKAMLSSYRTLLVTALGSAAAGAFIASRSPRLFLLSQSPQQPRPQSDSSEGCDGASREEYEQIRKTVRTNNCCFLFECTKQRNIASC